MFTLTERLEEEIEIDGEIYPLSLFFDVVLRFYDLMDDEELVDEEKIEIAFEMFVDTEEEFDFETMFHSVQAIVTTFIQPKEDEDSNNVGSGKKLYDLKQDAEYIYASFMQEYGIDLLDQQGILRWEKFKALLSGLRDKTKFKEVVGIRATELPSGKGMEDERKRIRELQRIYALKKSHNEQEAELDAMFNALVAGSR
ncbi:Gp15 family bacteriophage protein [Sutcliffiella halmapala]|uniref:Gp15 family bacteriophage protein n=1 Tax=Sutcliffiella halmapala TaxID=79882 RepID=UPI00099586AA|nr:Gp15 family bacteriophage protein [Sutcliffiella halmapala]